MTFFWQNDSATPPPSSLDKDDKLALNYFKHKHPNPKFVLKLNRSTSQHHQIEEPSVKDSYIKIGQNVYKLMPSEKRGGMIAGYGGDARVKYLKPIKCTFNLPSKATVKIDRYTKAQRRNYAHSVKDSEDEIAVDVGFFYDIGYRVKPKKEEYQTKGSRYQALLHRYAIMPDYGQELLEYLFYNHFKLSNRERHHIAIKACIEVFKLHSGIAAKSKKAIAHGDIKLENFLYDPKTKTLKLGDYGFADYGPQKRAIHIRGTPRNFPYIKNHRDLGKYTLEELDIFALKRSCTVPRWTYQINTNHPILTNEPWYSILPIYLLKKLKLEPYFLTGEKDGQYHSALFLTHTLILALYNKTVLITEDEAIQKALVVLYQADVLSEETINKVYEDQSYRIALSDLIEKLDTINIESLPSSASDSAVSHTETTDSLGRIIISL